MFFGASEICRQFPVGVSSPLCNEDQIDAVTALPLIKPYSDSAATAASPQREWTYAFVVAEMREKSYKQCVIFCHTRLDAEQKFVTNMWNKKLRYRWLHSAPRVKRKTRILPSYWGSVSLGPNFTGTGHPCQNVDTVRQVVDCTTTMPLEVFRQWNFLADFCFWSRFLWQMTNLSIWTPLRGSQEWRTTLVDGSLESPCSTFYSR